MLDYDTQDKELILGTYGHSYTVNEIKKKYPYTNQKKFNRKRYEKLPNIRITYNPLTAMQMQLKGMPNIVWGQKLGDNQHAFAFKCQDNQKRIINF